MGMNVPKGKEPAKPTKICPLGLERSTFLTWPCFRQHINSRGMPLTNELAKLQISNGRIVKANKFFFFDEKSKQVDPFHAPLFDFPGYQAPTSTTSVPSQPGSSRIICERNGKICR